MPTRQQRLLALLATSRAANLPTVATHVMVGFLLAAASLATTERGSDITLFAIIPILLGALFYIGGCLLGDAVDARYDAEHRPDRPIPLGILSARAIAVTGIGLIFIAWLLSCLTPLTGVMMAFEISGSEIISVLGSRPELFQVAFPWFHLSVSSTLAVAIVAYARYHKALGFMAPALMALCRALLVVWAASPIISINNSLLGTEFSAEVFAFAGATFLYTLTLSLVARNESDPNAKLPGLPFKIMLVVPPIILAGAFVINKHTLPPYGGFYSVDRHAALHLIIASLLYLSWSIYALTRLRHSIPAFVSAALAGFCLMDACFAALIGWQIALVCLALFLLALLLQRIAPAT